MKKGYNTWQSFGYYDNYYNQLGTSVTAIGYPDEEGHYYYMYSDTNSISNVTEYWYMALCDFTKGESGGALIDDRTGMLIGVITGYKEITPNEEYANFHVRITPDLCSRIKEHFD